MASRIISIFIQHTNKSLVLSWLIGSFYDYFPDPNATQINTWTGPVYLCNYRIEGSVIFIKAYSYLASPTNSVVMKALGMENHTYGQEKEVAVIEVREISGHTIVDFRIIESVALNWLKALAKAVIDNWSVDSRIEIGEHLIKRERAQKPRVQEARYLPVDPILKSRSPAQQAPQYDSNGVITLGTLKAYFPNANEQRLNELQLAQKLWDVDRLTFAEIDNRGDISRSTFQRRKNMLKEKGLLVR